MFYREEDRPKKFHTELPVIGGFLRAEVTTLNSRNNLWSSRGVGIFSLAGQKARLIDY